jgi:starch synthase
VRTLNKVVLFSKEYPPYVYGGAGVHVEYLSRALARRIEVEVRCFGDQEITAANPAVYGYAEWLEAKEHTDPRFAGVVDAFARSLAMAKDRLDADVVHCHTWYTDMGGVLASKLWNLPYVLTIHSLEPLRPWKVEQLGNAYHLSAWMERMAIEQADAIVAVSRETREDLLRLFDVEPERVHVIHNGIDPTEYRPVEGRDALIRYGIDPEQPYLLFVGRITRQKGIMHLVNAIPAIDPKMQIVLCAGAPDTPEIAREMEDGVARAAAQRQAVIWVREMVSRPDLIQLYTHAAVFCCPSVYEPFGIINLEAMACETAVIASAVGGIPEVVIPDETGLLVDPHLQPGTFDPADPAAFSAALADAINRLARDPELRRRLGAHGRKRVVEHFSWDSIAQLTIELYRSLVEPAPGITAHPRRGRIRAEGTGPHRP